MGKGLKKVYLMIYDAGAGHRSTAKALQKLIEQRQLPWEIHLVEAFKEIIGTSSSQNFYNNVILQKAWAKVITKPLLVPLFKLQIGFYHSVWLARFKKFWQQHQPDIVVSVMPYLNRVFYESLQATLPSVPFITLLTDLADCPPHFWIEQQEQFLICPTERAIEQAKNLGYSDEQIFHTSGLVINPQFYESIIIDRHLEKQRLGLDPNLPTGLVMFGGHGSNEMIEIAERLEQSSLNIQLIFICGKNKRLATILRRSQNRIPRYIEEFTKQIPYYMHLSDFFIGKPGNVSISEAIAMKLPVITELNALTLMQERYCCEWIANNELGIVISNFRNIDSAVAELIQPENLFRYRTNIKAFKNQAVFEVVEILEKILKHSYLDGLYENDPLLSIKQT
ncbi:MAG: UDP-N-acetylglucosamine--LPS N-acetylglucosamine transferase [Nostoc sp. NMS1]|uniref:MGDG synthase family glycosyltransferase n=1 Tax=unclassified Nostoc TaxID=2593658 RepID=UPI0025F2B51C|nr:MULTISPECIES: glycosyltransferase [unclassified Nostoc]MBN3907023.1 UDP-N-acetylglucosamine--LPS N-acetylglucosamine transferase [Nostoc sp. NMS1]MBN3992067.1 UDP-N-acetylglucosamine--LPS N-acetylglucosamine transferase [Nostoc sp. NMS2]